MKLRLSEPGMLTYAKMVLDIPVIYVMAAMKANGKIPKEAKQFGYQQPKEETKEQSSGSDADQAKKTARVNSAISIKMQG